MRFLDLFRSGPTASEIGRLGNRVKRDRERKKFKRTTDDLRRRAGLLPWEWPE